jgi:hypothetical protein
MGDIKEVFIFDGLFEMRSLRELIVRFQRETRLDRFDRVRDAENAVGTLLNNFNEVLMNGFAERGAKPRIVVEVVDGDED